MRISVSLPDDMIQRLNRLAKRQNVSRSKIVEMMLDQYVYDIAEDIRGERIGYS